MSSDNQSNEDTAAGITQADASSSVSMAAVDAEAIVAGLDEATRPPESRGLSSHVFGSLRPKMHHLLHRSSGTSIMTQTQQLIQNIQSAEDESQQLASIIDLSQMLVMGSEETLTGFPIKSVVPVLISLLKMEHNFELMHNACRALTYMLEALPRSSDIAVDAVPVLLDKLKTIECIDVAEQSLQALEKLSRKHGRIILQSNGIHTCLAYLEFFSSTAQRAAFSVVANCCQHLISNNDFPFVRASLATICSRLTQQDKKSAESACLCVARLVESFSYDERILKEIAAHGLLTNVSQLLVITPPMISSSIFITVLHMLVTMCACCSDLAVVLLKLDVTETLCFLLSGGSSDQWNPQHAEATSRTAQELYEIVCLIGELMPKLPTDGLFAINSYIYKSIPCCDKEGVSWQWKDEKGNWRPYSLVDTHIIESAHQSGEREVGLASRGRAYTIDFTAMQQIDDDTGNPLKVLRQENLSSQDPSKSPRASTMAEYDARADAFLEQTQLTDNFMKSLFGVLYQMYDSLASSSIRHKCVHAMLRIMFYGTPNLLRFILSSLPISSHIASLMMSNDQVLVVAALQMAFILMDKLPDIFVIYFHREGVIHQISRLSATDTVLDLSIKKDKSADIGHDATIALPSDRPLPDKRHSNPLPQLRLSDVLKRKKPLKHVSRKSSNRALDDASLGTSSSSGSADATASMSRPAQAGHSRLFGSKESGKSGTTSKMSFLSSFHPSRWVLSSADKSKDVPSSKAMKAPTASHKHSRQVDSREKIKQWINEHAIKFMNKYFNGESSASVNCHHVFNKLSEAVHCLGNDIQATDERCLREIAVILYEGDVSTFEIIHSGLITKLLGYLTSTRPGVEHKMSRFVRIQRFLQAFVGPLREVLCIKPLSFGHLVRATSCETVNLILLVYLCKLRKGEDAALISSVPSPFSALVSQFISCLHHLEEFQVKVSDPVTGATSSFGHRSSNALKYLSTHQIKCELLRHPSCTNMKNWKGSLVKIDPLASVHTIERFLIMKGYGRTKQSENTVRNDGDDDEAFSDSDIDDNLAAVSLSQSSARHQLELLIDNHVLPYNMTVYQAVKQYSLPASRDKVAAYDRLCHESSIWNNTHTLHYRSMSAENTAVIKSTASVKKAKSSKMHNELSVPSSDEESSTSGCVSVMDSYFNTSLASSVTVDDPALEILSLLRVLHAINVHWHLICDVTRPECHDVLPKHHFHSSKLNAKANRHLLDPLIIMSASMPAWLTEIGYSCSFLFTFDTRLSLLYATAMDRERALQHLQETSHMLPTDSSERSERSLMLRNERRKVVVCRDNIFKQAEKLLDDTCWSKAFLEIQYENEVGTGLGPTLEFFTIISHEMQGVDKNMWRGDVVQRNDYNVVGDALYVCSPNGLFPSPIAKHVKPSTLYSIRSKFHLLGKVLAKALIDSRMLDLPLSQAFYKWLLGLESILSISDLRDVDPVLAKSLGQLQDLVVKKKEIESCELHMSESKQLSLDLLTIDGSSVEDLGLDFVLPGYPDIELKRGGKEIAVTLDTLEEYIRLVVHWTLVEGVRRQFEAVREGFDFILSLSSINLFSSDELDQLFCGRSAEAWDVRHLMEACRPDHGYTHDSQSVQFLYEILSSYGVDEQRRFIRFITGSPRLPVGGLKSLVPPLTIVRTSMDTTDNPDDYLPSVMTCVNYLKLPDYTSVDVMRHKLEMAACEGQLAFHLS